MLKRTLVGLLLLHSLSTNAQAVIDLTYPFNSKTIYWPTEKGFELQPVFLGKTKKGYFYSAFKFCAPEHGGTHIDAPYHFSQAGLTVDQISPQQLMGEAVVIDVSSKTHNHPDYAITSHDIGHFEKTHRPLLKSDIVLFYTGWGKYWPDKTRYLGNDKPGDVMHLHFPGLSKDAALYLAKKKLKGVGLDTPSLDPGNSHDFEAHRILLGANIYGLENVANLKALQPLGMTLVVAPMKITGGSGAPVRLLAFSAAPYKTETK